MTEILYKEESYNIIGKCFEVYNNLGGNFSEIVYKDALEYEFKNTKIHFEREKKYSVNYKGKILPHEFYADFVVFDKIILEVKAVSILVDKFTGGTGVAGAAISSTAGSGIANPAALAAVDPTYALIAPIATSQIAASVIITAFLTPLLTGWVYKRNLKKAEEKAANAPSVEKVFAN
jgi:GxxExxY protein